MAGALSGDVDIPKVGKLPKVAVLGGVAAVIGLVIWEKHKQAAAASSTASGTAADPYPPDGSTGNPADPNSTDPDTGQTYGDEAAGYGGTGALGSGDLYDSGYGGLGTGGSGDAYPWDGTYGQSSDPYSMDPGTGITYGNENGTGGGSATGTSGPPFSTNAQWSQYVLNYFSQNQYSDLAGRTDAIGLYIAGSAVTAAQKQYIDDAIAVGGPPPVAGTGGFPPSIRVTGSTTTTGTATVPKVTGMSVANANAALRAVGLVPGAHSTDSGTVNGQTPGAGKKVQQGSTVDLSVGAATTAPVTLKAPGAPSVTQHGKTVNVGWGTVAGAKAYELLIQGATGHGTGTSHHDQVYSTNHAENIALAPGAYVARARAGASTSDVHGPWSSDHAFSVRK